jgi:type III pantothenate kinase
MGTNLTIDRGNTMTKLVVWNGNRQLMNCSIVKATTASIMRAISSLEVDRAMICSVAGSFAKLSEELLARGIELKELNAETPLPIEIDYATPQTLGTDRIAAAAGARALYPGRDILIADIGTAATYDWLTADGHFAGGNIAPGIGMRLKALNHFTARLPLIRSNGDIKAWGDTTETAMRSGAIYGVVAEICYYRQMLSKEAVVVLTGGWGSDVAKLLPFEVKVEDLLVNTGLNSIMDYGEAIGQTNI